MDSPQTIFHQTTIRILIAIIFLFCLSFDAYGRSHSSAISHGVRSGGHGREQVGLFAYENENPEAASSDNGFRRNYRQWKNLPPEEKNELRNRMNRYKQMPAQDRQQYRRKLEKWKQLPPEDRQRIQKSLKDWRDLSPEEKEAIRRRFGNE